MKKVSLLPPCLLKYWFFLQLLNFSSQHHFIAAVLSVSRSKFLAKLETLVIIDIQDSAFANIPNHKFVVHLLNFK